MTNNRKQYIKNVAEKIKRSGWSICVNEPKEYKEVLHILRDETSKKYKVVPLDDKYVLIKEK